MFDVHAPVALVDELHGLVGPVDSDQQVVGGGVKLRLLLRQFHGGNGLVGRLQAPGTHRLVVPMEGGFVVHPSAQVVLYRRRFQPSVLHTVALGHLFLLETAVLYQLGIEPSVARMVDFFKEYPIHRGRNRGSFLAHVQGNGYSFWLGGTPCQQTSGHHGQIKISGFFHV